jgi:hypothetical protein
MSLHYHDYTGALLSWEAGSDTARHVAALEPYRAGRRVWSSGTCGSAEAYPVLGGGIWSSGPCVSA